MTVPAVVPLSAIAATSQRLPPYGRDVAAEVAAGRSPNVYIVTGPDAWDHARRRLASHGTGSVMVLVPGEDPCAYRWPRIPNGALIDARTLPRLDAVAIGRAVVSGGTPMVFVLADGGAFVCASPGWTNPLCQTREAA